MDPAAQGQLSQEQAQFMRDWQEWNTWRNMEVDELDVEDWLADERDSAAAAEKLNTVGPVRPT